MVGNAKSRRDEWIHQVVANKEFADCKFHFNFVAEYR